MKKIFLFILMSICFINIGFSGDLQDKEIQDYINGRVPSDLIYEITLDLQEDNFSEVIQLTLENGLRVHFANENYTTILYNSSEVFGFYSTSKNLIVINVELIYEWATQFNYTDEEFSLRVWTTFQHELTHYMDVKGLLPEIEETLNMTITNYPYIDNMAYFYDLYESPAIFSIDSVVRESLNFENIFLINNQYPSDEYGVEIIARTMAVCVEENKNYTFYYEMVKYNNNTYDYQNETYSYCGGYEFHPSIDNQYNNLYEEFIIAYINFYNPSIIKPIYNVEEPIEDSFSIISLLLQKIIEFTTLSIFPLWLTTAFLIFILGILTSLNNIISFIKNFLKFKK